MVCKRDLAPRQKVRNNLKERLAPCRKIQNRKVEESLSWVRLQWRLVRLKD